MICDDCQPYLVNIFMVSRNLISWDFFLLFERLCVDFVELGEQKRQATLKSNLSVVGSLFIETHDKRRDFLVCLLL